MRSWILLLFLFLPNLSAGAAEPGKVLATVNGVPIYQSEVDFEVAQALGKLTATDAARQQLADEALQRLIDRRVILHELADSNFRASQAEVDLELKRFAEKVKGLGTTMQEELSKRGFTEEIMRGQIDWKITWGRYLEKYLSEANLQKYFDARQREFDGTRLRVAQVFKKAKLADAATRQDAMKSLAELKQQIESGQLTFAEAAADHSDSPTKGQGGEVGWIERHGPMPAAFHQAAFQLEAGEVGPPVETPLGVHLITCLEVEAGKKTLADVRDQVQQAATIYLFDYLAGKGRDKLEIERSE